MVPAVHLHNVSKTFGSPGGAFSSPSMKRIYQHGSRYTVNTNAVSVALQEISFQVEEGEICGLIGTPGSGKTSLIRILAALIAPDSGEARVFGYDTARQPHQVQNLTNRISVEASFFHTRSAMDNLLSGMRGSAAGSSRQRHQAVEMLERLDLPAARWSQPMGVLGAQDQQKVALVRAMLTRPRLLLMDEPARNLDRHTRLAFFELLDDLRNADGVTVLLSAQQASEVSAICDRLAMLSAGRLVAEGEPGAIQTLLPAGHVEPALVELFLATQYR